MSEKAKTPMVEMFDQAMKNYEQALKAALKVQEEVARLWSSVTPQTEATQDYQKQMTKMLEEMFPGAQKRMEESLKQIEQTGKVSLDLLKLGMESARAGSPAELQNKLGEIWKTSVGLIQSNLQSMSAANTRMFEMWSDYAKRATEPASGKAK